MPHPRSPQPAGSPCPADCLEHPEHVYILCYGRPVVVSSIDTESGPISHYVGWTSQQPPVRRVRAHGARSAHYIAQIRPGTLADEDHAKRHEFCPRCGKSLWYYGESPACPGD